MPLIEDRSRPASMAVAVAVAVASRGTTAPTAAVLAIGRYRPVGAALGRQRLHHHDVLADLAADIGLNRAEALDALGTGAFGDGFQVSVRQAPELASPASPSPSSTGSAPSPVPSPSRCSSRRSWPRLADFQLTLGPSRP